jgi:hypothetical protein
MLLDEPGRWTPERLAAMLAQTIIRGSLSFG